MSDSPKPDPKPGNRRCDLPGCSAWVPEQGLCPAHLAEERAIRRLMTEIHKQDRPAGEDVRAARRRQFQRTAIPDPRRRQR